MEVQPHHAGQLQNVADLEEHQAGTPSTCAPPIKVHREAPWLDARQGSSTSKEVGGDGVRDRPCQTTKVHALTTSLRLAPKTVITVTGFSNQSLRETFGDHRNVVHDLKGRPARVISPAGCRIGHKAGLSRATWGPSPRMICWPEMSVWRDRRSDRPERQESRPSPRPPLDGDRKAIPQDVDARCPRERWVWNELRRMTLDPRAR